MKPFSKFLTLLFIMSFSSANVKADEFDCLRDLVGGTVKWDMDWQRDRTDQDVTYRVVNVTESQIQKNLKEVAVELLAEGPAKIHKRVSRIRMDYAAEIFCKRANPRIAPATEMVRVNSAVKVESKLKSFAPSELSYRTFENGKWRPRRVSEGERLRVCATRDSLYACSEKDFESLSKASPVTVDGRVKHQYPFIRFIDGGWTKGSEADLNRVGEIAVCSAMGRKFNCLNEEKNSYSMQLEKVSERSL